MWHSNSPPQAEQKLLQEFYLTEEEKEAHERESLMGQQKTKQMCCPRLTQRHLVACVLLVALVASAVTERVTFKVMVDKLENYRFFLLELIVACNATLMFCMLVYKRFRAREEITDETTAVSKWNFVLIALLDTCMLLLTVIPGGRVPAPLTVILLQAATPAQLGVGALFRSFRSRYRWTHWSGSLAILVAAFVSMVPILFRHEPSGYSKEVLLNCVLFVAAALPGALSMHYREALVVKQQMSPYYVNFWVALFQFLFGMVFAPLALPMQRLTEHKAWAAAGWKLMAVNWRHGGECLFGGSSSSPQDFCWLAILVVVLYLVATVAMSFLVTALLGSVTVRTIQYALVVGVPLSMVSLEFYNASSVVAQMHGAWPKWEPFDFVACVIVVGGLVAFHFHEEPGVVAETPKLNNYAADERATDTGKRKRGHHSEGGEGGDDSDDDDSDDDADADDGEEGDFTSSEDEAV